ncbi:MAG: DUF3524 domain-containing protein [Gammaproteobacteria bacterium]|nr:DUF3524 domain-containing protein [Gammaproteobacteria bacterium]
MRILLLSAYDTDSHRAWCQGLMQNMPQHEWCYLTLPGRYFSWRIRGNGLSFVYGEQAAQLKQPFDLILATSMVDLATFKGLAPHLAHTPSILYCHENQFAYPKSDQQHTSVEPQMVNLYAALAADHVLFNSEYNRQSFLQGATALLKRLPDHAPLAAINSIQHKSQVLPVPITFNSSLTPKHFEKGDTLNVIWNHRWEYDKGPDTLAACIELAYARNLNVQFSVCGMSFRQKPEALIRLQQIKLPNVSHMGTFEKRSEYRQQLAEHHVVLSTAIHEFQGLAVLEGAALGCTPLAPNRLAYPEWIPTENLYPNGSTEDEAAAICDQLHHWQQRGLPPTVDVCHYDWQSLIDKYEQCFQTLHNKKQ